MHKTFNSYITNVNKNYFNETKQLSIFNPDITKSWPNELKKYFCKLFYHIRGHFSDFLWVLGNYADSNEEKKIIVENICEEFGYRISHEQLYLDFANALSVDIQQEIILETHYLPFIKNFNKTHLNWLLKHNWVEKFSAFSAYEMLDNIDYKQLYNLASSFDLNPQALRFFKVHVQVSHYNRTEAIIKNYWLNNNELVENGFNFIYTHQLKMWQELNRSCLAF